ncbi:putative tyrosinase [Colletotrichum sublineola]|uniref:Putative tyrosinase n=1 Tax=Colletotrichum sublineola TaxID=1173701 RepID=A0A066X1G3_COLSU|nr:putative tyrosinase [Colletotrichum sublineola]
MSAENPQYEYAVIQGIPVPSREKPGLRQEFTNWELEKPEERIQVSLSIRALQLLYNEDYTKTLSYFQIAGIHGYPGTVDWDNSDEPTHKSGMISNIYLLYPQLSHHFHVAQTLPGSVRGEYPVFLLASDRRLMLFQPTIYQFMGKVIEKLSFSIEADKNAWIKESTQWILPYWDWALNTEVPALFSPTTVKTDSRDCAPTSIALLQSLTFLFQIKWSRCSGTSRWAIESSEPDGSQSLGINNYKNIGIAIKEHGYYGPFLNLKYPKNVKDLENLQDPVAKLRKYLRDDHETDDQYLERVNAYIDETYHNTGRILREEKGGLFQKSHDVASDAVYDDYMINVSYDRYGYKNGAHYTIHSLLEELLTPEMATESGTSSPRPYHHAGSIFTFSSLVTSGEMHTAGQPRCGNCKQQLEKAVLSRASIPLTNSSTRMPPIRSLTWVAKAAYVFKGKAKHYPEIGILSVYHDYEPLPSVTHDKDAGARHEEYRDS